MEAAQPYSEAITQVVRDLAAGGSGSDSPLLTPRPEIRRVAYIVIAADRGLCGAYNSSVIREAERAVLAEVARGRDYSVIAVGRKVESYFRYRDYRIDAAFSGFSDQPSYEDARQVGAAATRAFLAGEIDEVQIVYTEYRSAGVAGRRAADADAAGARRDPRIDRRRTPDGARRATSSSPIPRGSSTCCCRATSTRASTPRCSTRPRRSTPPASGR